MDSIHEEGEKFDNQYAEGLIDDDTQENSEWGQGWDDEDEISSDEEEKYTPRGPEKFCFCIPWAPLHYIHCIVAIIFTVLGIANGFYWFIRGCQEVANNSLPFKTILYGLIHMWCNLPLGVGGWLYFRYLRWHKEHPEYIEGLVDAHYFFVIHCFVISMWGIIGGIIFFNFMISGYFFTSGDEAEPNPKAIWLTGAIFTGGGMLWNTILYFVTEKFARPWPSPYNYHYD